METKIHVASKNFSVVLRSSALLLANNIVLGQEVTTLVKLYYCSKSLIGSRKEKEVNIKCQFQTVRDKFIEL